MGSYQQLLISPSTSVLEAMRVIDQGNAQIALCVDEQRALIGTLTDGDIRRSLLRGNSLDDSVDNLLNRNFKYVKNAKGFTDEALSIMRASQISQIPVLNDSFQIVDLLSWHELIGQSSLITKNNLVVIMAGGKGTRLLPHTKNCPKPMLEINNKPMLEILLHHCIDCGYKKFRFSVNYLKEQVIDYFGDGSRFGVDISYIYEKTPLGTAGSLGLLSREVNHPILVLNADVLTKLDFSHFINYHSQQKAVATIGVRDYFVDIPYGVIKNEGTDLIGFEEKPTMRHLVNAGIYVVNPELLNCIKTNENIDMPELLQRALALGMKVSLCPIHEYWIDVGRPETLDKAHKDWPLVN